MRALLIMTLSITLLAFQSSGTAHHSGSMFNHEEVVEFVAVVKEFQYTNPHSWLIVNVEQEDGSVDTWGFEAEGPSRLLGAGIKKGDFTPGTKIRIEGYPMHDRRPAALWLSAVRLEDGKEFNPRKGFDIDY